VFISPVTHQPSIALLAPALSGGRLLGFVHLDLGIVSSLRSLVVNNVPGVSVGLATYSHGQLLINTIPGRVADTGLGASGVVELGDERPGSRPLIAFYGGHRAMAAALPITFGLGHRTTVAFATEQAANPTFGDTISTGEEIVLALAILMLIGSIAGLSVSQRRMTDELATDPLTGLRNRRALMADLPRACQQASERAPAYLWLFDLNGFKRYNDSFGHVAGDTLLTRLGYRLRETVGEAGETYRLGGDEFCVLIRASVENPHELFSEAREALTEAGGGFTIDASGGVAEIPREGDEAEQVLRIADQRMYRDKAGSRAGAAEVIGAVLHAALAQRHPELSGHSDEVAGDVELLAHAIGLGDDDVAAIMKAGDLHDVGKLGIPDEILTKPGPLTDREWEFMKRHTVMGEQIIDAAGPSLGPVGSLVRASHERWDGMGYPDGLRGEEIPLGARIITICDSFRAMLDRRPYKPPMAVADAVAELRRCAGTQFDPYLVDVFCSLIERQASLQEIGSAASNAYAWHPAELSSRP
jgi:diguanylate cyclase (GGDEF)-like protein